MAQRAPNRLARERSVYLLQHAHNPVDWHPWGAEAIAAARARGVPLFVSVGYSTCYWCHVMERESFEDPAAAAVLNRVAVPVKVDREERPDVDEVLMTACQVFTQLTEGRASGGWPLNAFLHPDTLEPFFVGTYYPPQPAHGRPAFTQLLAAVEAAWQKDRDGLARQAAQVARLVRAQLESAPNEAGEGAGARVAGERADGWAAALVPQVASALMRAHDPTHGGFGGAPKFPTAAYLRALWHAPDADGALARALRRTLDHMAIGGLFDQVGGGFHRYCVDADWTVPHFEKMLYDSAQLAPLYALASQRWGDEWYAHIARRTVRFMLRDLRGAHGAFLSALDAEVGAREGASYLWSEAEVRRTLLDAAFTKDEVELVSWLYGVGGAPNFRDPHDLHAAPAHVLRLAERPDALAAQRARSAGDVQRLLDRANEALLAERNRRPQPLVDDKVIAAWNGMAIEACAVVGQALGEPEFVRAADGAATWLLATMRGADGTLARTWRDGACGPGGFLEDHACMANALIALGRMDEAGELMRVAARRFADAGGAWFDVAEGQNELWVRGRSLDDGALPSATSSALRALGALARHGHGHGHGHGQAKAHADVAAWARGTAERLIASVAGAVREQPVAASGTVLEAARLHEALAPLRVELRWHAGSDRATLTLRLPEGHHATAGEAFTVRSTPGTPAVTVHALTPPTTRPGGGPPAWHDGAHLELRFAAVPPAAPELEVVAQVCNDFACLPPVCVPVRGEPPDTLRHP